MTGVNVLGRMKITLTLNSGDSANAVPHYHKLRTRVTHIWGDRKGQPNRSAIVRPHSGGTAYLITVAPVPGKYAYKLLAGKLRYCNFSKIFVCAIFIIGDEYILT